ncbi:MAG: geranylgeranylglycerol-phosphate geranylgeranyltransferase [Brumimicrobium sp.]
MLKLIRVVNLLIVAWMMLVLAAYLDMSYTLHYFHFQTPELWLLVLIVIFIAAAGNCINDYFDVVADNINKPQKIIVEKYISKSKVLKIYFVLNALALIFSFVLSYLSGIWLFLFIHTISIISLWFYSLKFKKILIFGNIVVALLTATVPIYVGILLNADFGAINPLQPYPLNLTNYENFPLKLSFAFALIAFLLNLIREIVKDVVDIEGDKMIDAKTIPIVFGKKVTKRIVSTLLLLFAASFFPVYSLTRQGFLSHNGMYPFYFCIVMALGLILLLWKDSARKTWKNISLFLKLIIAIVAILPLYWML